jgi:hypothetical protein
MQARAKRERGSAKPVCRACSAARKWKSSIQPDGGEGLAKGKGYRREAGSEGSVEQKRESMNKNRIRGVSVGRADGLLRSPYPSSMQSVDSAIARGRRLNLPREIWSTGQKSAEDIVDLTVGEANEALQGRKAEKQIGQAGNGERRSERERSGK